LFYFLLLLIDELCMQRDTLFPESCVSVFYNFFRGDGYDYYYLREFEDLAKKMVAAFAVYAKKSHLMMRMLVCEKEVTDSR